jgi:hypothetical protein
LPDGSGFFVQPYWPQGPFFVNTVLLHVDRDGSWEIIRAVDNTWHLFPSPSPDGAHLAFSAMILDSNAWLLEGF